VTFRGVLPRHGNTRYKAMPLGADEFICVLRLHTLPHRLDIDPPLTDCGPRQRKAAWRLVRELWSQVIARPVGLDDVRLHRWPAVLGSVGR